MSDLLNGYFANLDEAFAFLAVNGFVCQSTKWCGVWQNGKRTATITEVGWSYLVEFH